MHGGGKRADPNAHSVPAMVASAFFSFAIRLWFFDIVAVRILPGTFGVREVTSVVTPSGRSVLHRS